MTTILGAAVSGMVHNQQVLDTVGNNLANVKSSAFKFTRPLAQGRPDAAATPEASRMGVAETSFDRIYATGPAEVTGDPMQFTIDGDGFFRVRDHDGSIAYTRLGTLGRDNAGNITASGGRFLEPPLVLPEGLSNPSIDVNGVITARDADNTTVEVGRLTLVSFLNPAGLEARGDGLYRETANSGPSREGPPGEAGFGPLLPGSLEGSNVQVAEEFTAMIIAQRAYQAAVRTFSVGDEMLQIATNLTR